MIELQHVSKTYSGKTVLQSINAQFEPGAVHGIVGANGAGKSTLFKCIAGLEHHDGEISYTGGNLNNTIGFLPTNPPFMSRITGLEYLRLATQAREVEWKQIEQKNVFDLPLNKYAAQYSTGMKKKLALTGILLQNNNVFILDEPFNGVDVHSNLLIGELIQSLKKRGKTILLSSHLFQSLAEHCDLMYHLEDGALQPGVESDRFHEVQEKMIGKGLDSKIDLFFDEE